jgi:hypothetical protein
LITDPRWALVEQKTSIPRALVASVVCYLLEHANQAHPARGSVESFSSELCAVALNVAAEDVEKIRRALELPGIEFIDQDFVVDWVIIQRDKEDLTSTQRSRAHRERLKAKRDAERKAKFDVACNAVAGVAATPATPLQSYPAVVPAKFSGDLTDSNAVAGVAATPRSDQIRAKSWLYGTPESPGYGLLIVSTALGKDLEFAAYLLRNWTGDLGGDYALLRSILEAAKDLQGTRFKAVVHDRIKAAKERTPKGEPLPFPLTSVAKG